MNPMKTSPRLARHMLPLLVALAGCAGALPPQLIGDLQQAHAPWGGEGPGCVVTVVDGERIEHRVFGLADLRARAPLTPDHALHIVSTSKQFTAAAIALLAHEGRLSLDDELSAHVPELPDYDHTLRLRHLLAHRSGLLDFVELRELWGGIAPHAPCSRQEVLALLARIDWLMFPPGERYAYSNSNYFLLALVVERVSGRSLAGFCRERLFAPLGMHDTRFDAAGEARPGDAVGYTRGDDGFEAAPRVPGVIGDAGLWTTPRDLARWLRASARGELPGGLSDALARADAPYAFGQRIGRYRGLRVQSHTGGEPGWRAQAMRFPSEDLSVICQCNTSAMSVNRLATSVVDALLAARVAAPAAGVSWTVAQRDEIIGAYRDPLTGAVVQVEASAPGASDVQDLTVVGPWFRGAFKPIGPRTLRSTRGVFEVRLVFTPSDGPARALRVESDGEGPLSERLERVRLVEPEGLDLAPYEGRYATSRIPASLDVQVDGATLSVILTDPRGGEDRTPLMPTIADRFGFPGGELHFLRGPEGQVRAVEINEPMAAGLVYHRVAPDQDMPALDAARARSLAELALGCVDRRFPYKPGHVHARGAHAAPHARFTPAFAGCFDWHSFARATGDADFERLLMDRARELYGKDRDCPVAYEPSGEDFISPCLAEADLMRRVLPQAAFVRWLDRFLPSPDDPRFAPMATPPEVLDPEDPRIGHLIGLSFHRAWTFRGMARVLPEDDPRRDVYERLSARHAHAGLERMHVSGYGGAHWLATFALKALDEM